MFGLLSPDTSILQLFRGSTGSPQATQVLVAQGKGTAEMGSTSNNHVAVSLKIASVLYVNGSQVYFVSHSLLRLVTFELKLQTVHRTPTVV